ncbi:heavy-metal-associated domain-containing protein [Lacinutrix venerupis]|uniref:Heavy metal transporter n=1 Tax=Lacinutrix venerupis TaxID=1486034 RepID=A0AAC9PVT3_9FLAO|nr:heavy metal-associated domain-containing protein [Lacinutrix venerupis]APX99139.1 heavy metal transporter [Lacinutrix venerupis]
MKNLKNILVIVILTITAFNCKNETQPEIKTVETATEVKKVELDPNATYAKAEFKIEGMTCAMGCAKTIEKKMAKMEGVKSATVDFERELAMVEYDEAKVTHESLKNTVTGVSDTYSVKNMNTVEHFSKAEKQ